MPLPVTYENLGLYAAAQIAGLNATNTGAARQLPAFLGDRAPLVQRHFPAGWLNNIRIRVMPALPAPSLAALAQDMAYHSVTDFQTACNTVNVNLFNVLMGFAHPLPAVLNGITYDDVIYLKTAVQNDLSIIIHELVHTLQWSRFGPAGFLARYIRGYVNHYPNYPANPAETRAYFYENQFKTLATAAGVNLTPVIYQQLSMNPNAPLFATMITTLNGLHSMAITEAIASGGM